jgi:ribA/ribD-fused uncharacterized protein
LTSDDVVTFYNTEENEFSNFFPAPITVDSRVFPTLEHFWQFSKVAEVDPVTADRIATAATIEEAHLAGANAPEIRGDWDEAKGGILRRGMVAKFQQHPALKAQLLATAGKTIVNIDTDAWAGLQEVDGRQTGSNHVGSLLCSVRDELLC